MRFSLNISKAHAPCQALYSLWLNNEFKLLTYSGCGIILIGMTELQNE